MPENDHTPIWQFSHIHNSTTKCLLNCLRRSGCLPWTLQGWSLGSRKCLVVIGHEIWHGTTTAYLLNMHNICSLSMQKQHFLKCQIFLRWESTSYVLEHINKKFAGRGLLFNTRKSNRNSHTWHKMAISDITGFPFLFIVHKRTYNTQMSLYLRIHNWRI